MKALPGDGTATQAMAGLERMAREQDQRISEVVKRERSRLLNFIRRRVPDPGDAEDVLQDVFSELVEANQLLMPIEHVTGWLFRVARNRIIDLFRRRKPERATGPSALGDDEERLGLEDLLPSPDAGPDALYARSSSSTRSRRRSTNCRTNSARSSSRTNWKDAASRRSPRRRA